MNIPYRDAARLLPRALGRAVSVAGLLSAVLAVAGEATMAQKVPLPNPLGASEAVDYALANNPSLLAVREQIREQDGLLIQARAGRLPTAGLSGSYSRLQDDLVKGPTGALLSDDKSWTVDFTVSQALYAGGAIRAGEAAQKEQREAAKLAYAAAVNDTILSVRQAFLTVLLNREIIKVREQALVVLQAELERVRSRREAGTGSDFDVLRAEVAVANARPPLISAKNAYRNSQDKLLQVLGASDVPTSEQIELGVTGELEAGAWDLSLADSMSKARATRPELLRQEHLVKAAGHGIDAARSGYKPTVSAYAGYEMAKVSWVSKTSEHNDGWVAGVRADWAIFDGRKTQGKVAAARSQERQLRHSSDAASLSVAVEVRQANSSLLESRELLQASRKVIAQAEESLRLSCVRFDTGTATQLDILQAQSALTEARYNHAQARYSNALAVASMQRAVGQVVAASSAP